MRVRLPGDAPQDAMLLGELAFDVSTLLQVILVAVVWDVLLTPFVLPPLMGLFRRLEPDRVHAT